MLFQPFFKPLRAVYIAAFALALISGPVLAEKTYGPGVTDSEIKIGQTMPYSGPASAYGIIGKAEAAYFQKINDEGGVNGRKINLISLDDGYSPPKTVEQVRRLVEQDDVLLLFQNLGTAANSAIIKYVNSRKVPHLLLATGASKFNDPQNYPYTTPGNPSYQTEARIYAKYILKTYPNAKIGVLYQNDDYGKDYLNGFKDGLGDKAAKMIISEVSYEVSDPTVDSQIVTLKGSGADVLFNITTPKFAALAIRKVYDIGWRPVHFVNNVSVSVSAVLQPAGLEKSVGLITANYGMDPTDPQWQNDPNMREYFAWLKKYFPEGNPANINISYGYGQAYALVDLLKRCRDDLSRDNVMKQATSIRTLRTPLLLPGIAINTNPGDRFGIKQMQLQKFDGKTWVLFGDLISE